MKNVPNKTLIVYSVVFLLLLIIFNPLLVTSSYNLQIDEISDCNIYPTDRDWIWKDTFPNYSPQGMPDFDQKQKQWKIIIDGGNGVAESIALNDDNQLISVGSDVLPEEVIISPGDDCQLDSITSGDDKFKWAYSGPAAIANCFWWFDSMFANPNGIPGDGNDEFPLVEKYLDDDHSTNNVQYLIEDLALITNTSNRGLTTVDDLGLALDFWFTNKTIDDRFGKKIENGPTLQYIEDEISNSQNVILSLGFYDYEIGVLRLDQSQPIRSFNKFLQNYTWWDYQNFSPAVNRIDSIKILIESSSVDNCEIEINIYDTLGGEPLGTSILDPGYIEDPTWIKFQFEPGIELVPYETYYFDVRQLENGYHYEWFYESPDPYYQGEGWMNQNPYDIYGLPFDWTFETEYYDPPPGSIRKDSHYVTCAGVNLDNSKIAFSDPFFDLNNSESLNHNDAKNVSHDVFLINESCPCPDLNFSFWLPDYPTIYNHTIVETAIVVSLIPDEEPPEVKIIKPENSIYFLDNEVGPFILPVIIGFIEIQVNVTDNRDVRSVKFLINGESVFNDKSEPYKWKWEEGAFFVQTLEIDAVDSAGNHGYSLLTVLKFF